VQKLASSFRDPSGFVYTRDDALLRQVNHRYASNFDIFQKQLYEILVERKLIVSHEQVDLSLAFSEDAYAVIKPQTIPFISYPYEWSFAQLKDAALTTLRIQKIALKRGLTLKDASAYNIQFLNGEPIFIDTLSFEPFAGQQWTAYRQFCQHFLAPLSLAVSRDISLLSLLRVYIDGIPLPLTSRMLPWLSRLNLGMQMHIHTHARFETRHAASSIEQLKTKSIKRDTLLNIVSNLENIIRSLNWSTEKTAWHNYYDGDSYTEAGFQHKKAIFETYLDIARPNSLWDLGANTGVFSQLAGQRNISTVAWDYDYGAVQQHYENIKASNHEHCSVLPLVQDLSNPSPAVGWSNHERDSFIERAQGVDMVSALALIHHVVIANNVPIDHFVRFLTSLGKYAIVEFVPKTDHKVQTLLKSRQDIFDDYNRATFEEILRRYFTIERIDEIQESSRVLYLLRSKPENTSPSN
jgi:hypothetical protein